MKILSVDDAVKNINVYLGKSIFCPYFVVADDAGDVAAFKKILADKFRLLYVSDFCNGDFPLDTDLFVERLKNLEKNSACFGLGEYIFLTGQENILRSLQDKTFNRKIIFISQRIAIRRKYRYAPKIYISCISRSTYRNYIFFAIRHIMITTWQNSARNYRDFSFNRLFTC